MVPEEADHAPVLLALHKLPDFQRSGPKLSDLGITFVGRTNPSHGEVVCASHQLSGPCFHPLHGYLHTGSEYMGEQGGDMASLHNVTLTPLLFLLQYSTRWVMCR